MWLYLDCSKWSSGMQIDVMHDEFWSYVHQRKFTYSQKKQQIQLYTHFLE